MDIPNFSIETSMFIFPSKTIYKNCNSTQITGNGNTTRKIFLPQ